MNEAEKRGWSRAVTVLKDDLLTKLKANLEKHKRDYAEALAGYKTTAKESLAKQLDDAKKALNKNYKMILNRIEDFNDDEPVAESMMLLQQIVFTMPVPEDHTKAYEVAIDMASWETKPEIVLTQSEFQCYVRDDWEWKDRFSHLNKVYSNK